MTTLLHSLRLLSGLTTMLKAPFDGLGPLLGVWIWAFSAGPLGSAPIGPFAGIKGFLKDSILSGP